MSLLIPVIVFQPPIGKSKAERWVAQGRLQAALDLVTRLQRVASAGEIFVLAADPEDQESLTSAGGIPIDAQPTPFHFGRVLMDQVERRGWDRFAYFGGASAPLLSAEYLQDVFERASAGQGAQCWVNNYHSTDWAIVRVTKEMMQLADRLPTDNAIGWVLSHDAGYQVQAMPPEAATSMDVDTPSDILVMTGHPQLGAHLRGFVQSAPEASLERIAAIQELMRKPGTTLTVIGRGSSRAWRALEDRAQIWVRMLVEERGMVASRRVAQGKVRSLVASFLEQAGPGRFVRELCEISDGVLWDTRVWMAHRGSWPSDADRFAADLGWPDQVADTALRELTEVISAAACPILTGGHGLVSGGIYALLDTALGA
jgi:hypothetical protein